MHASHTCMRELRFAMQELTLVSMVLSSWLRVKAGPPEKSSFEAISILHATPQAVLRYPGWRRAVHVVWAISAVLWIGLTIAYGV